MSQNMGYLQWKPNLISYPVVYDEICLHVQRVNIAGNTFSTFPTIFLHFPTLSKQYTNVYDIAMLRMHASDAHIYCEILWSTKRTIKKLLNIKIPCFYHLKSWYCHTRQCSFKDIWESLTSRLLLWILFLPLIKLNPPSKFKSQHFFFKYL